MSDAGRAVPQPGERGGERRPPLGSWARAYAIVIAALAADILLLAWLTVRFR